jgi:hypothetical protein
MASPLRAQKNTGKNRSPPPFFVVADPNSLFHERGHRAPPSGPIGEGLRELVGIQILNPATSFATVLSRSTSGQGHRAREWLVPDTVSVIRRRGI